jgi:YfiH family protein
MIGDMNGFQIRQQGGLTLIAAPTLSGIPGLAHGFTTREGGVSAGGYRSLNLGAGSGDDVALVRENRRRLCAVAGLDPQGVRLARQVHGALTAVLSDAQMGADGPVAGVDALVTARAGLTLLVLSADCTVILLVAPNERAIAAVHAGWKGTVAGVAAAAVSTLAQQFGADPATIIAAVGPAIGPCCYEVDQPVIAAVERAFPAAASDLLTPGRDGHAYLDLWAANRRQLVEAGVRESAIAVAGLCTRCHGDLFFSQRRDGLKTGRFGAFIALT